MSRMVDDDFWRPPVDKRAVVERELARVGLSLNTPEKLAPPPSDDVAERYGPPLPGWWYWRGELVFAPGATFPLSRDLAKVLHLDHPPFEPEVPAMPPPPADDELASIDGMRR